MTFLTFPKGFFWGTASSGPQTEGRFDGDGTVMEKERISGTIGTTKNLKNSSTILDLIKLPIIISITKKMCN